MSNRVLDQIIHNWPAKILSIAAAFLLFFFTNLAQLEERFVTVPLEVQLDRDMAAVSSAPTTVRIGIRGEAGRVSTLREEEFSAFVDFRDMDEPGFARAPVQVSPAGTARGIDPLEIRVEPAEVGLELEYRQSRSVEVVPNIEDNPAPGYELRQSFLTPSAVEIEGPESRVAGIESVSTETVSLAGRRDDFNIRVRLERPDPFVSFPGGDTVDYRGIIEERVVLTTFEDIDITVIDLDTEFDLVNALPSGLIRVQGSQLEIEAVQQDQLRLEITASSITEPGRHELQVRPRVPSGLLTLRFEPQTVELVIERVEDES
ncbi:CdaR family protein [Spirochaeta africana]|uniref:CdaR family protein n=1 Tax=Spirochaeta africana TaxID=46355 RepID=UPI00145E1249|nr:CdaR family protein [Spirochaeta africana]